MLTVYFGNQAVPLGSYTVDDYGDELQTWPKGHWTGREMPVLVNFWTLVDDDSAYFVLRQPVDDYGFYST